jgi:hypothetical protein
VGVALMEDFLEVSSLWDLRVGLGFKLGG